MKGELVRISRDYKSGKPEITLTVDGDPESLEGLMGKPLTVELKHYRQRRSLEANAYSWVLTQKIAEAIGQSVAWVHNDMLRKYGQIAVLDGQLIYVVLPDTEAVRIEIDASEGYHLRPTSQVKDGKDGKPYRTWLMLRGSHEYDSAEMARFIDGIVQEAKDLGIETITENEKRELPRAGRTGGESRNDTGHHRASVHPFGGQAGGEAERSGGTEAVHKGRGKIRRRASGAVPQAEPRAVDGDDAPG